MGCSRGAGMALAELYKALKALAFYPESHPLREEILQRAFQAIQGVDERKWSFPGCASYRTFVCRS